MTTEIKFIGEYGESVVVHADQRDNWWEGFVEIEYLLKPKENYHLSGSDERNAGAKQTIRMSAKASRQLLAALQKIHF
jgi:hypothetical protein